MVWFVSYGFQASCRRPAMRMVDARSLPAHSASVESSLSSPNWFSSC